MRVDVVVILEPGWQLLEDRDGVWPWVHAGIVTFQGFDEGLADAVAFRATDWREAWNKVQGCGEVGGFGGGIGGTIISQPLDGERGAERVEPALDAVKHHVTDHLAGNAAAMGGDPGDDFAVMGVDGEGDANTAFTGKRPEAAMASERLFLGVRLPGPRAGSRSR